MASPAEIKLRGKRVADFLNSGDFDFAVQELATRYVREWRDALGADAAGLAKREAAHAKATALEDVVMQLKSLVRSGETQEALDLKEKKAAGTGQN